MDAHLQEKGRRGDSRRDADGPSIAAFCRSLPLGLPLTSGRPWFFNRRSGVGRSRLFNGDSKPRGRANSSRRHYDAAPL